VFFLAAAIEVMPTRIAGLPAAVNLRYPRG
jgi:hypothetical protein